MNAPDGRVQRIKDTVGLSSIVGERIRLRREGRWFRGCCPFHDDSTPSFWVNDEIGRYGCFGCDAAGDIINFVVQSEGCTFAEALDQLDDGYAPSRHLLPAPSLAEDSRERVKRARRIWSQAEPINGTPAETYLARRALPLENLPDPLDLRFARLSFDGSLDLYPTLVAPIQTIDGEFAGIQRTFLTEDGRKLDEHNSKRSLGILKGNAIQIANVNEVYRHVFVCEGLEDGLSLARMYGDPVFVSAGAGSIRSLNLPKECASVTIGADNDPVGLKAAVEAAAAFGNRGFKTHILRPDWRHKDWNDYLQFWDSRRADYADIELEWALG